MDVLLVEENPSEFDKLKQVRRQNVKPVSLQLRSHTMVVQQKLGQGAFASVYQVIAWATTLQCLSLVLNITMQVHCPSTNALGLLHCIFFGVLLARWQPQCLADRQVYSYKGCTLALRQAIYAWHTLGE